MLSAKATLLLAAATLMAAAPCPAQADDTTPEPFISVTAADFIDWYDEDGIRPAIDIYYNRVDGLLFFGGVEYRREKVLHPRLRALTGWSSARDQNHYEITIEQPFYNQDSFALGISFYDRTAWSREDGETISDIENNLVAHFMRQDFRDYFRRDGVTVYAKFRATPALALRLEHRSDELSSLSTQQDVWSAFRRNHDWRENPELFVGVLDGTEAFEGRMKSYVGSFVYDDRDEFRREGMLARGFFEFSGGSVGGDYSFRKYVIDVRRLFRLTETQTLGLRGSWGIGSGSDFPSHKLFYLGGIRSLRGRKYKEFAGKNMFFASAEYGVMVTRAFEVILFVDSGDVWYGTTGFDTSDLETDLGVGFRLDAPTVGDLRIDVARQATSEEADIRTTVRLTYPS